MNRRRLSWSAKGGCKVKPCRRCRTPFKPATSGNIYCDACTPTARLERQVRGARNWRKRNPEHAARIKRAWDLKTQFGLTLEQYDGMLKKQGGGCAICRSKVSRRGSLTVDHCHTTGKVRGILCDLCNRGLGLFRDSTENLRRAVVYLKGNS